MPGRHVWFYPGKLISLLALVMFQAGCPSSTTTVPVSGTVTWENGQPLTNARVLFQPIADAEVVAPPPMSSSRTDHEGRFVLKTNAGQSGAVVGRHRISVYEIPADENADGQELHTEFLVPDAGTEQADFVMPLATRSSRRQ